MGNFDKGSQIFKQKPDMGNYPEAELQSILFTSNLHLISLSADYKKENLSIVFLFHLFTFFLSSYLRIYIIALLFHEAKSLLTKLDEHRQFASFHCDDSITGFHLS